MKYYFSKYLIISIAIVTGFCFLPVVANAFSVSESTIEHVIEPGKKVSGSFSVKMKRILPQRLMSLSEDFSRAAK